MNILHSISFLEEDFHQLFETGEMLLILESQWHLSGNENFGYNSSVPLDSKVSVVFHENFGRMSTLRNALSEY